MSKLQEAVFVPTLPACFSIDLSTVTSRLDQLEVLRHEPRLASLRVPIYSFWSSVTVTSTWVPFLSFTSSPCSSVNALSIRRSRYLRSGPSTVICAFSGLLELGEGTILATIPGTVELGCSGFRVESNFSSAILADLAVRGCAISFLTLERVALSNLFLLFLCSMHP
jgi:hypothetical protein